MTIEKIRERITKKLSEARSTLEAFADDVTGINPVHAMTWSRRAFTAAADVHVFSMLERYVDIIEKRDGFTVSDAIRELDETSFHEMATGCRAASSSATSNLMERALGQAWSEIWPVPPGRGMFGSARRWFVQLENGTAT